MYQNGLFIFRRDFRIIDNIGLYELQKKCKHIYTIFIYTPEQITSKNDFLSNNALQFMNQCVFELKQTIRQMNGDLHLFYGSNEEVLKKILNTLSIDIVGFNKDYTPYARQRDTTLVSLCESLNIKVLENLDYYLLNPVEHKIYKKFTPFYNYVNKIPISNPLTYNSFSFKKIPSIRDEIFFDVTNYTLFLKGGRIHAIERLQHVKTLKYIKDDLNISTSLLSPYIKFGCISIREVYHVMKHEKEFIRQLYWRDFYALLLLYNPRLLGSPMKEYYQKIKWSSSDTWFQAWKHGITGFPVVDASMRQLNTTGYMHNRSRLIVSNFLIKILFISWQKGEKYFAQQLIDYDPSNNNGNWQWSAGSGADSQPYFRLFNPWIQSFRFDRECTFIKNWIPELKEVPNKSIHHWYSDWSYYNTSYPKPICDYNIQKNKFIQYMKQLY